MRSSTIKRLGASLAALAAGAVVTSCVPATRSEPTLEEKCEELALYCRDLPAAREDLEQCYQVGRRGLREAEHQDQCFVAWDECIDDCVYLYQRREEPRDGG